MIIAMNGPNSETWNMSSDGRVRLHRVQQDEEQRNSIENFLTIPDDQPGSHRERSPTRLQNGFNRKHRSLSSPKTTGSSNSGSSNRNPSSAKPKKARRYLGTASTSLTSIPNAIKLSMLNSGLLSVGEIFGRRRRLKNTFCYLYMMQINCQAVESLRDDVRSGLTNVEKESTQY